MSVNFAFRIPTSDLLSETLRESIDAEKAAGKELSERLEAHHARVEKLLAGVDSRTVATFTKEVDALRAETIGLYHAAYKWWNTQASLYASAVGEMSGEQSKRKADLAQAKTDAVDKLAAMGRTVETMPNYSSNRHLAAREFNEVIVSSDPMVVDATARHKQVVVYRNSLTSVENALLEGQRAAKAKLKKCAESLIGATL